MISLNWTEVTAQSKMQRIYSRLPFKYEKRREKEIHMYLLICAEETEERRSRNYRDWLPIRDGWENGKKQGKEGSRAVRR